MAARVTTMALGLWLVVLILGGLGLQPLAGLPIVGNLGAGEAAPPALPERVQAAVAKHTTVAPATRAVQAPVRAAPVPSHRPAFTAPFPAKTRPPARTTPATPRARGPASPAPAPSLPSTSPSNTAPGRTRIPPGQAKKGPVPPSSTPATTPVGNGNGNGKSNGKVKTP
jgi:hypothetical protein